MLRSEFDYLGKLFMVLLQEFQGSKGLRRGFSKVGGGFSRYAQTSELLVSSAAFANWPAAWSCSSMAITGVSALEALRACVCA